MAAFSFSSNWPTFQQRHLDTTSAFFPPPPPELFSFHDNFSFINPLPPLESNHHFSSFNNGTVTTTNLSFHNPVLRYPTLSSSYMPPPHQSLPLLTPLPDLTQSFIDHECYPHPPIPNYVFPMEQELPPFPEIYQGVGFDGEIPFYEEQSNCVQVVEENGNGGGRLSAQSMAARVRRRKISEKTLELGKLVPGGHRMNTAEMFQAAFKYVKFLQAQVGVLKVMEPSEELHDLVTSHSVQEKLYHAGKCIVTRTFEESLAIDPSRNQEYKTG